MRKFIIAGAIAAFAFTLLITIGFARAADALVYKSQPAIVSAPAANYWNGFYVQAGWGYAWGDSDPDVNVVNTTTKIKKVYLSTETGTVNQRDSGAMLGGGVGFDWRVMQSVVVGAEVEWDKTWIKGSTIYNNSQNTHEIKSLGLLTGRVGILVDSFNGNMSPRHLVYFKGGGAWRNEENTVTGTVNGSTSNTAWGWALGGGIESVVTPAWRVRLEGMHARFSDQNTPVSGVGSTSKFSSTTYAGNVRSTDHLTWVSVRAIWHQNF